MMRRATSIDTGSHLHSCDTTITESEYVVAISPIVSWICLDLLASELLSDEQLWNAGANCGRNVSIEANGKQVNAVVIDMVTQFNGDVFLLLKLTA